MKHAPLRKPMLRFAASLLCTGLFLASGTVSAAGLMHGSYQIAAQDIDYMDLTSVTVEYEAYAPDFSVMKEQEEDTRAFPCVWPVRFTDAGYISSYFGYRVDPVSGEGTEFHQGIDLADRDNSKIYAAASGTVVELRDSPSYGLTMVIDHGNGYTTRYSHCASILAELGDTVEQGQIIATMGNTGKSTGTHLDFRVYFEGTAVDPLKVLGTD